MGDLTTNVGQDDHAPQKWSFYLPSEYRPCQLFEALILGVYAQLG